MPEPPSRSRPRSSDERPLTVAIHAQISPRGGAGGVIQFITELVRSLGRLEGPESYWIVGPPHDPDWLKPYLGPNQRIYRWPLWKLAAGRAAAIGSAAARGSGPFGQRIIGIADRLSRLDPARPAVPSDGGLYRRVGCDLVHFPFQRWISCGLPFVYNPHDLQHAHFPGFFSAEELAWRRAVYGAGCRQAATVAVSSDWVKKDVVREYALAPEKVQVIPWTSPIAAHREPSAEELDAARLKYRLARPYALYPAVTWEHKNHLRLIEALALLRDRGALDIDLVCTGHRTAHWDRIRRRVAGLGLERWVRFTGAVPATELRCLYRQACFVIVPTLFEAVSQPVFESWAEGVPVACSTVTSLPEQVGDAALLFDPFSVDAIADAFARMAGDASLRERLLRAAACRSRDFSAERSAKAYRALYRRAAGRTLSSEDRVLLAWDWMRAPMTRQEP